jgi:hypothetical protein
MGAIGAARQRRLSVRKRKEVKDKPEQSSCVACRHAFWICR